MVARRLGVFGQLGARMNKQHYTEQGRQAYRQGRGFIFGDPPGWQRKAFAAGYNAERAAWRKANPAGDEWAEMARKSADFCKGMLK